MYAQRVRTAIALGVYRVATTGRHRNLRDQVSRSCRESDQGERSGDRIHAGAFQQGVAREARTKMHWSKSLFRVRFARNGRWRNRRICLHLLCRAIMPSGHQCRFTKEPVREGFEPSDRPRRLFDAGLPMKLLSLATDVISRRVVRGFSKLPLWETSVWRIGAGLRPERSPRVRWRRLRLRNQANGAKTAHRANGA